MRVIHVAAGILTDAQCRVLLMQRLPGTHLAGLWEFPGGKLEANESNEQALARELREELGLEAHAFAPLISLPWTYPEKTIRLHALRVTGWRGEPQAREGHPLRWSALDDIDADAMPPADRPILAALRLPPCYAITLPKWGQVHFSGQLREALMNISNNEPYPIPDVLLQLRFPGSDRDDVRRIARDLLSIYPALQQRLLINGDIELARGLGVGVHLHAAQLFERQERPLPRDVWIGASCHDAGELGRAAGIGADFATLSPVCATVSHPRTHPMGWERFAQLVADARLPVYALGGVGPDDLDRARAAGAQGVAGINGFFPAS
ncbi:MAG: Nudix family hydrolase [Rhodanobacteraceae bacterium]